MIQSYISVHEMAYTYMCYHSNIRVPGLNSITDSTDNATPLKSTKSTNSNIPRNKFEFIQNLHLNLNREIPRNPSFSLCGFRGCSIFSENCHVCAMIQSYISVRELAYTYVHAITLNLGAFSQDIRIVSM